MLLTAPIASAQITATLSSEAGVLKHHANSLLEALQWWEQVLRQLVWPVPVMSATAELLGATFCCHGRWPAGSCLSCILRNCPSGLLLFSQPVWPFQNGCNFSRAPHNCKRSDWPCSSLLLASGCSLACARLPMVSISFLYTRCSGHEAGTQQVSWSVGWWAS